MRQIIYKWLFIIHSVEYCYSLLRQFYRNQSQPRKKKKKKNRSYFNNSAPHEPNYSIFIWILIFNLLFLVHLIIGLTFVVYSCLFVIIKFCWKYISILYFLSLKWLYLWADNFCIIIYRIYELARNMKYTFKNRK